MERLVLVPGMIIKSNYSDRQHKVISVIRGCICPRYTDELGYTNSGMEKESPEHIHVSCKDLGDNMYSGFNGYVEKEDKIENVWRPGDEILIVSYPANYQFDLFNVEEFEKFRDYFFKNAK